MKRQRRTHAPTPRYPDMASIRERREVLLGLAGLAGLALVPGCFNSDKGTFQLDGDISEIDSATPQFTAYLPLPPDVRTLYFADGGFIDYRVELLVDGHAPASWIEAHTDELLAAIDERLGQEPVTRFAPDEDLTELNVAIVSIIQAVAAGDDSSDEVVDASLIVHDYNPESGLDGDIPDSGM